MFPYLSIWHGREDEAENFSHSSMAYAVINSCRSVHDDEIKRWDNNEVLSTEAARINDLIR